MKHLTSTLIFAIATLLQSPAGANLEWELLTISESDPVASSFQCPYEGYEHWRCLKPEMFYNPLDNAFYAVEVRFNRWHEPYSRATVVWMTGDNIGTGFRYEGSDPAWFYQDELDSLHNIRSVEIIFLSLIEKDHIGGVWANQSGYRNSSAIYIKILESLRNRNILSGGWITHVGESNGAMMAAHALAFHGANKFLARAIFFGGPFGARFYEECTNPGYFAAVGSGLPYQTETTIRSLMDLWHGYDRQTECFCCSNGNADEAFLHYNSLLNDEALKAFDGLALHVFTGVDDFLGNWLTMSALDWYNTVTAAEKTHEIIQDCGHEARLERARDFLSREPMNYQASYPLVSFFHTPEELLDPLATPSTRFSSGEIHGKVWGSAPGDALVCVENMGIDEGRCLLPENFSEPTARGWYFDVDGGFWRYHRAVADFAPGSRFRIIWMNVSTLKVGTPVLVAVDRP